MTVLGLNLTKKNYGNLISFHPIKNLIAIEIYKYERNMKENYLPSWCLLVYVASLCSLYSFYSQMALQHRNQSQNHFGEEWILFLEECFPFNISEALAQETVSCWPNNSLLGQYVNSLTALNPILLSYHILTIFSRRTYSRRLQVYSKILVL